MHPYRAQPSLSAQLRVSAEALIKSGTAPTTHIPSAGTQALTLLHTMASAPASASDALKLLHELQVHQVELDLQQEQADHDRYQLEEAQAHYFALFDMAPFGYLTIDGHDHVMEANRMACAWLGIKQAMVGVRRIDDYLEPDCRQIMRSALTRLRADGTSETLSIQSLTGGDNLNVQANILPGSDLILMALRP